MHIHRYMNKTRKELRYGKGGDERDDANNLIKCLQELKSEDSRWVYDHSIVYAEDGDETGKYVRLQNVFFMSPEMRENYRKFHDVVLFDFTANKNRFGAPMANLVGFDEEGG